MVRTLISLPESDKIWLDAYSHRHRRSRAEIVRRALHNFRRAVEDGGFKPSLRATAGLWKGRGIDAVDYVRRLRSEWNPR